MTPRARPLQPNRFLTETGCPLAPAPARPDYMKRIKADSIAPELKAWFVTQIQALAMRHDLIGPDIRLVNVQDYHQQLRS